MKTKALTAAQIDTLAQRLSDTPIEPATSAKKAGDNFARLLAARIGAERAALAFTSIMIAETFDQAEARLTLVLDYGNPDPSGEPITTAEEEPKAAPAPVVGKRKAIRDQAESGALPRPLRDLHHGAIGGDGMKITREFSPGDRYTYDFGLCSYKNGWAQVDTAQEESYFGTWANPARLLIFNYREGDTTLREAASPEEFAAELREIDAWNRAQGYGPAKIDPGYDTAMKVVFEGLGLVDLLH